MPSCFFFLSATDPKARATVSILLLKMLKKFCAITSQFNFKVHFKVVHVNNCFQDGGIRLPHDFVAFVPGISLG